MNAKQREIYKIGDRVVVTRGLERGRRGTVVMCAPQFLELTGYLVAVDLDGDDFDKRDMYAVSGLRRLTLVEEIADLESRTS